MTLGSIFYTSLYAPHGQSSFILGDHVLHICTQSLSEYKILGHPVLSLSPLFFEKGSLDSRARLAARKFQTSFSLCPQLWSYRHKVHIRSLNVLLGTQTQTLVFTPLPTELSPKPLFLIFFLKDSF
jgi:hypothetical protein